MQLYCASSKARSDSCSSITTIICTDTSCLVPTLSWRHLHEVGVSSSVPTSFQCQTTMPTCICQILPSVPPCISSHSSSAGSACMALQQHSKLSHAAVDTEAKDTANTEGDTCCSFISTTSNSYPVSADSTCAELSSLAELGVHSRR